MQLILDPYQEIITQTDCVEPTFMLGDHLNGFDKHGNNIVLSTLDLYGKENNKFYKVIYHQILPDYIKQLYSNLEICYSSKHQEDTNFIFLKIRDCSMHELFLKSRTTRMVLSKCSVGMRNSGYLTIQSHGATPIRPPALNSRSEKLLINSLQVARSKPSDITFDFLSRK